MALLNLLQMLSHTSSDVRIAACDAFSCIGKYTKNISDQLLRECIPALLPLVKDKNTAVKASAEQALIDVLQLQQSQSVYHVRKAYLFTFIKLPCTKAYFLIIIN